MKARPSRRERRAREEPFQVRVRLELINQVKEVEF
jgi:hypothetical protein